jgi:hypothetical protein
MIPSKVKVAGVTYEVKEVEGLVSDHDLYGQVMYRNNIIKLDSTLHQELKEQVFVHELFHAIYLKRDTWNTMKKWYEGQRMCCIKCCRIIILIWDKSSRKMSPFVELSRRREVNKKWRLIQERLAY